MKISIDGEALKLLEDFIYYSEKDPGSIADPMEYDIDGFKLRIKLLKKAVEKATE